MEQLANGVYKLLYQIASIEIEVVLLVVLLVMAVMVLDAVSIVTRKKREKTGLKAGTVTVSVDGSKSLPVKNYISDIQGLAGRPDAIIQENGFIIPVERKPLARKIRDRYVAQLLVYMRLIEEFEGKKPPYGYLILGSNCRRIKIENTEKRQAWLQDIIDKMQAHLENGAVVKPDPHPKKCKKCTVRFSCSDWKENGNHKEEPLVNLEKKEDRLAG